MYPRRSPPQQHKSIMGGSSISNGNGNVNDTTSNNSSSHQQSSPSSSSSATSGTSMKLAGCITNRTGCGSTLSLYSNTSTSDLLAGVDQNNIHFHHHHKHMHHAAHSHQRHQQQHVSGGGAGSGASLSNAAGKRGKKHNWGTRKRAGMSFLIVIAFFAIFGLIILTEVFMIDERSHAGMNHGLYGGRVVDSLPDYEDVKDDYYNMDGNFWSDNKLGFVQFRDNKLKIQDAVSGDGGHLAGILRGSANSANSLSGGNTATVGKGMAAAAGARGAVASYLAWGKVLSAKDEHTLPPYPIGMTPTDGAWQVVNGTRFKFFVFSAYYDRRDGGRLVRIVGATKTRSPERVWCRFWYVNRNVSAGESQRARYTSATVMALVKTIRENWNLKYSACFIICPVRAPELDVPQYVSIVARLRAPPGNLLQVRNTDWDPDFTRNISTSSGAVGATIQASAMAVSAAASVAKVRTAPPTSEQLPDKIAVCVKPFHFEYDQALYLMEYLELYALLGVSHFTFYNHTTGPRATCVLQHYISGDIPSNLTAWDVEEMPADAHNLNNTQAPKRYESRNYEKPTVNILPWNLRMRSQKEIRTEGLFAALNDCLYRSMYRYKYVALVDLDEFIVPRRDDTLIELINSLNRRLRSRNTGVYSFQNAFFYLQFGDDPLVYQSTSLSPEEIRLRAALVTQRKTRRRSKLHPQKQRSKYICKPEAVVEAGNHFVWEFAAGRGSLNVPPTDAILQHYRVCEFGGNDCIKAHSVVDRTATKYTNRLVQRVAYVYKYLKERCDLPDLPMPPKEALAEMQPIKSNEALKRNEVKARTERSLDDVKSNNEQATQIQAASKATTATTNTTTSSKPKLKSVTVTAATMATTSQTNATTKSKHNSENSAARSQILRRRRKYVVFADGDDGRPVAKVEYEYK